MMPANAINQGVAATAMLSLFATPLFAHEGTPHDVDDLRRAWEFDPFIVIPLLLSAWLYARGLRRTWREAGGVGRGIATWQAASFAGGWITLVVALVSPLHPWGRALFSVHMVQHELLMLVAAPLLVLGKPLPVFLAALPIAWARALAQWSNASWWQSVWRLISNALVAWLLHAIVLWTWHAPALMDSVIHNEWAHAAQHISFLGSALLFWWAVIHGQQRALGYGMAVLYMFTTALHSGALGVLMTFATRLWYPAYAHTTQSWGLTPLEDQQLGGIIMWIPAGVVYIIAGLALMAGWMRESENRVLRRRNLTTAATAGAAGILLVVTIGGGCDRERPVVQVARQLTGGDEHVGRDKIVLLGCVSCHTVPGVRGPDAHVGPNLAHIASRSYIGTGLKNDPHNMIEWIRRPRDIEPRAAMPNLYVSEADAQDIACYLYTLR